MSRRDWINAHQKELAEARQKVAIAREEGFSSHLDEEDPDTLGQRFPGVRPDDRSKLKEDLIGLDILIQKDCTEWIAAARMGDDDARMRLLRGLFAFEFCREAKAEGYLIDEQFYETLSLELCGGSFEKEEDRMTGLTCQILGRELCDQVPDERERDQLLAAKSA